MVEDEAREGEEWKVSVSDDCPGVDKCHGCLRWCSTCGDVAHVCDMRLRGERCDAHPVPPTWQVLRERRKKAERKRFDGQELIREAEAELSDIVDNEKARRAFAEQEAEIERKFWGAA